MIRFGRLLLWLLMLQACSARHEETQQQFFAEPLASTASLSIGQPAPEVALPDTAGHIVTLSSMKGKYVLVDFWARWCRTCRVQNINLRNTFAKYKDRGFTIYGISLDRSGTDWKNAIVEDRILWTQVSDLKYLRSEVARRYNVVSLPYSVLLNPDGIIIGVNLQDQALDFKLAQIFDKK